MRFKYYEEKNRFYLFLPQTWKPPLDMFSTKSAPLHGPFVIISIAYSFTLLETRFVKAFKYHFIQLGGVRRPSLRMCRNWIFWKQNRSSPLKWINRPLFFFFFWNIGHNKSENRAGPRIPGRHSYDWFDSFYGQRLVAMAQKWLASLPKEHSFAFKLR